MTHNPLTGPDESGGTPGGSPTTVAVIIPFFQREPKLLAATVASILGQQAPAMRYAIIVVDDASPVPATEALAGIEIPTPHALVVVSQPNAGPGAARNRGIAEALALQAEFVAFIDSDDVWHPHHIEQALAALRQTGSPFYFADILNDGASWFSTLAFMRDTVTAEERATGVTRTLDRDTAVNAIATECLPHITTVVCAAQILGAVRFDEAFRRACEDQLFFVDLARRATSVTFSTRCAGRRGEGVSIYRETLSWGSTAAPQRLLDELAYRQRSILAGHLSLRTKRALFASGQGKLNHLVFLLLRNLRGNPRLSFRSLVAFFRRAPLFAIALPVALLWLPLHRRGLIRDARALEQSLGMGSSGAAR